MTTEPPIRRLTLLLTSPRVPSGVLTRDAWLALEQAAVILAREDEPQAEALAAAGMTVTHPDPSGDEAPHLARALVARALADGLVVWVGSSDGDPGLTDGIAGEVSRLADPPEVEVVVGSYDVPGARLLDLVAVMDRLRSPGGCPWDAEQTHTSLVPYLVEEAHEAVEAIESGDRAHMVEELGDVLLQVAFHARVAQEHGSDPFDIDDVAAGIVAKLVRRHPHVFADSGPDPDAADDTAAGPDAAAVEVSWESIKDAEKAGAPGAGEGGVLAGIPVAMPPLARATKIASRLRRRSRQDLLDAVLTAHSDPDSDPDAAGRLGDPGARLLALVVELEAAG
ncbi:MAG: MazG family protein, partial [Lapillicoccus sp.]